MAEELILLKDIVIPAGTVLSRAASKVERFGDDHFEVVVGLTPNTSGSFVYTVDADPELLSEYFAPARHIVGPR